MSAFFGFVVGYIVGARAGNDGFDRLERAFQDIRHSDEFRNFVQLLRDHLQGTAQTVSDRLASDAPLSHDVEGLVAEARRRLSSSSD